MSILSPELHEHSTLTALTFTIGSVRLAVPASDLQEIMDPLPITRVPGASSFAPAVLNVRGGVLPLADLRIPLGIAASGPTQPESVRFLVLEVGMGAEPATADMVHEVMSIPMAQIVPLPPTSGWPPEFMRGIFRIADESFVLLPDLSAIFTTMAQRAVLA
jgi:purine-binding chemotaxis protein CheW